MSRFLRRAEVKAGPLIVLALVIAAGVGFWLWRNSQKEDPKNWASQEDSFLLWCGACKKDLPVSAANAKAIAKQGDKLQCPECSKFEAQWGRPAASPAGGAGSGMMQP